MTPKEFAQTYLNGTLRPFDVMITFSSVEHSGLGRYGDILNPWGDLITLAQVSRNCSWHYYLGRYLGQILCRVRTVSEHLVTRNVVTTVLDCCTIHNMFYAVHNTVCHTMSGLILCAILCH